MGVYRDARKDLYGKRLSRIERDIERLKEKSTNTSSS